MKPRVLIVGTVPYNEKSTSRAFDSYFHFWEKENLAQIFSNTKTPAKGHCGTLFQITDQRMLKRWMGKSITTGKIFKYENLPEVWEDNELEVGDNRTEKLYHLGSKKSAAIYLLRGLLWRKKFWCSTGLNKWLEEFDPECVFLSFSDDYFIPQIAYYVAQKFDIPIVSSIGDDYYFNYRKTFSPLYHIYKLTYRKVIRKIFRYSGSAIYIGNKIRDKYNREFGLDGKTVYLTSSIRRRPFKEIQKDNLVVSYFGNIRLGRNKSLIDIAEILGQINPLYKVHVFSNEQNEEYYKILVDNKKIEFHGSISYAEVQKKTMDSDILVIVEGFDKKDVDISRYSLSTKVADSLASGVAILAYGSAECGAISYARETGCITTCVDKNQLYDAIFNLINCVEYQKHNYDSAIRVTEENHMLENSTKIFEELVQKVVEEHKNAK